MVLIPVELPVEVLIPEQLQSLTTVVMSVLAVARLKEVVTRESGLLDEMKTRPHL